ncbi:MAG: hypothetical protein FWC70_09980 [Defluviitaleaceae bacterium]|nr:hypothetical protein [Defluviitaleaceae bacterium]
MSDNIFVDTNIIIYARVKKEIVKYDLPHIPSKPDAVPQKKDVADCVLQLQHLFFVLRVSI